MKRESFFWIILVFSLIIIACKKSDSLTSTFSADSIANNNDLFSFKIGDWTAYPYFTNSPDEDSFFSSWSPEITYAVSSAVKKVFIKMKDGSIVPAPEFINVEPYDSGFLYQKGNLDNKILLWWIQKVDGTRPDADSCILR